MFFERNEMFEMEKKIINYLNNVLKLNRNKIQYINDTDYSIGLMFDGDNDSRYSIPRYKWRDFNDMMIYGKGSKFKFTLFDFLEYDISMIKNMNLIYRKRGMVYSDYPIIRTQKILNDINWMVSSCPALCPLSTIRWSICARITSAKAP